MLDSGSFLGRSTLTSKPTSKPTARRTGTWQPPRREDGPEHKRSDSASSPSEAQRDNICVPPSGVHPRTMPNPNTTTQSHSSGKGKAPTSSLDNVPPPNRQARASFPDRSLSSSTSQRAEQSRPRSRTSDVDSAPKPARSTAGRYQAEVDQIEKERDADDLSFVDSQSQSLTDRSSVVDSLSQLGISQELSQDTLRINRQHAKSPSNPSRTLPVQSERRLAGSLFMTPQPAQPTQQKRTTNQATAGAQSTQQKRAAHQVAVEAPVQPVQQRRPAHHAAAEAQPAQPKQSAHQDTTTAPPTQQSRIAHQVAAEAPAQSTQQKRPARRDTTTAQPTRQQKRPAPQATPSEETPQKKKQQRENYHHRNQRYENLKPASQAQRKHAVESLKAAWGITDAALMSLPFAPRRTTDPGQPIMQPLDWNAPLLDGLVLLARETKGDFARACEVAKDAYENDRLFSGSTQLTADIVASALGGLRGDGTPPSQQLKRATPGGTQRAAAVPRPAAAAAPAPPASTAGPSASGQRAPPSPSASPALSPAMSPKAPIKTEFGSSTPRRSTSAMDDESSGAEDIEYLEAKARLQKIKLDLALEKLEFFKLEHKMRQRDLERLRRHGGFVEDALCV